MKVITYLIFIFQITLLQTYASKDKLPSEKEFYSESVEIALRVLKECPPQTCVPIGLGRSPSSVLAVLSILLDDAYQLPLSNFRYNLKENGAFPNKVLSFEREERLHNHLSEFLPSEEALKGRKVLLIDYSLGGSSLFAAETYIRRYLKKVNQQTQIASFMMLRRYTDNLEIINSVAHDQYKIKAFTAFDMSKYPVVDSYLLSSSLDQFSLYGSFDLKVDKRVRKNSKHRLLVKRVRSALNGSQELKQKFANTLGVSLSEIERRIGKVGLSCSLLMQGLF